jgi:triosephosphate isomerase
MVGARYAIINHSERKSRGEGRDIAKKKLEAALRNGLSVVLCVGETERNESGKHFSDVADEIIFFLSNLTDDKRARVILAYEPIWAIGKKGSQAATPHDLHEMSLYIRKVLIDGMGQRLAYGIPLLYGGSVDSTNASALTETGAIKGFLLGRASLEEGELIAILEALEKTYDFI